jgi:DivIVA domain-containing protein
MPLTPEEIKGHTFRVNLRGYDRDEVDAFVQRIAADYEAAIAAIASAADPYGSVGQEVSTVLRTAKESAERLRRDTDEEVKALRQRAVDEAAEAKRRAAEEAAATLEQAREKAIRLTTEAERHSTEAVEQSEATKQRASEEAVDIRRRAAEGAAATLDAATDRAERLTREAQRHARELRENAEQQVDDMLKEAATRHELLREHERELHRRVDAIEGALEGLRSELRSGGPIPPKSAAANAASPVVADRLRALEPEFDQVASALVDDDRAEDVIHVEEPSPGPEAPPARAQTPGAPGE